MSDGQIPTSSSSNETLRESIDTSLPPSTRAADDDQQQHKKDMEKQTDFEVISSGHSISDDENKKGVLQTS